MLDRQTDTNRRVGPDEMQRQRQFRDRVAEYVQAAAQRAGRPLRAHIVTYGCQQNEDDSEKLMGMLVDMGFVPADRREDADVILVNTCTIRDHAERKALGNIGALKGLKRDNPQLKIGVCGCMVQQPHIPEEMKSKFLHVDFIFGPHDIYRFPEILYKSYFGAERASYVRQSEGRIAEGLPQYRRQTATAYVTIMSGCNNYCSYCIVPYVRGRERSRDESAILDEVSGLVRGGCREITLLGQNVNSYGRDLSGSVCFSELLRDIDSIPGDFRIRFMTSHPKDIGRDVIDAMADCAKVCKQLHLPVQSGSDEILRRMNRKYTAADYMEIIRYARERMPGIVLSSDIIVGFPGETEQMFEDTLRLVAQVHYDMLFSFIYSRRKGTPAFDMEGQIPYADKLRRFNRLIQAQNAISAAANEQYRGQTVRVLCLGRNEKNPALLEGRTDGNKLVFFPGGDALVGNFATVRITEPKTYFMFGEIQ